jgi:hypothetical protein
MTRRVVLACLVALVLPAPAAAQFQTISTGDAEGSIPVRSTGSVVVDWESDPESCAGVGRCGLDGLTTWRPPARGDVFISGDGHGRTFASVSLGGFFDLAGAAATTQVRREGGLCADATRPEAFALLESSGTELSFGLADVLGGLFATRCAGPVIEDVAATLPAISVPTSRLRRGRLAVNLAGGGTFAGHGLRGTVTSTVRLRLGAPQRGEEEDHPRLRMERVRYLSNRFRVTEVRGEVALDVRGRADRRECAPLDACGLAGSLRVVPRATAGSVDLTARGAARLGRRSALAAVGLRPGPAPPGVRVFGSGFWAGAGLLVASIGPEGGATPCRDSVLLRHGLLTFEPVAGRQLRISFYGAVAGFPAFGAGARTRCAGPLLGGVAPLAEAEVPVRAFGSRRLELPLTRPTTIEDDGWTIAGRSAVTVVLERRPVVEFIRGEPAF